MSASRPWTRRCCATRHAGPEACSSTPRYTSPEYPAPSSIMTDRPHEFLPAESLPSPTGHSIMDSLPAELLENICGHVIAAEPHAAATAMFALRLTYRAICQKTERLFCKVAFRRVTVYTSFSSVERLSALSQVPKFAAEVRTLVVRDLEENIAFSFDEIQDHLRDPATNELKNQLMNGLEHDRGELFFRQNCGLDVDMLSQGLVALQKLQDVEVYPAFSPREDSTAVNVRTTSSLFWIVLFSLAVCGIRPRSMRLMEEKGWGAGYEALDLRTLAAPNKVLISMEQLRLLELSLQVPAGNDECVDLCAQDLVRMLHYPPDLEALTLRWDDCDTFGSRKTLHAVACQVHLRHLRSFRLQGFHCDGADLEVFLQKHKSLKSLELHDLDIVGEDVSYTDVLRKASHELQLDEFRSCQIAQGGFRTRYRTLGRIGERAEVVNADNMSLADFVFITRPKRYQAWIESWENVPQRLAELADDVEVTALSSTPRTERELQEWEEAF